MLSGKPHIAVAVSGQGRTLQNFLEGRFDFDVGAVICSSPKAKAMALAEKHELPVFVGDFNDIQPDILNQWLVEHHILWVVLAGFLKPFPALSAYENRVINIHPSLLPRYGGHGMYGTRVHDAVLAAKDPTSGATVHFVNERYDEGSIIAQAETDIRGITTSEELAARVFALECAFYPEVVSRLIKNQLPLEGGRTWRFEKELKC